MHVECDTFSRGGGAMDLLERIAKLEADVAKLKPDDRPTRKTRGGVIQYAIIATIIALGIIIAVDNMGSQLDEQFSRIGETLQAE